MVEVCVTERSNATTNVVSDCWTVLVDETVKPFFARTPHDAPMSGGVRPLILLLVRG